MISLVVAAVLLLIHALVCLMLWTLMKLGLLPVRGHMLAVIVLVPLWGPLLVVLLSIRSAMFGEGLKESALESLRFNDELHRSMSVPSGEDDAGVVPLEEALIVNDPAYRRRLMLSMLTEEPDAYLAQLQAAKLNDDVEVAHYAATAVAQISKESDLKLQQLERAFKTDPSADKEYPEQVEVVELDVAFAGFIAPEHALGGGVAIEHFLQAALQLALLAQRGVDGGRKCDEDAELDGRAQQEGPDALEHHVNQKLDDGKRDKDIGQTGGIAALVLDEV